MTFSFHNAAEIRHAYIIASPNKEDALSSALDVAAAAVCRSEGQVPCRRCSACRKVLASGNRPVHPDVKIIRYGEGSAKNEIAVNQVRDVIADAVVLPNESEHKVYIFADGDVMNINAQNAALKLLEEPPTGVILILCAPRADVFLTTVRSRCTEINAAPEADRADVEEDGLAEEYLMYISRHDRSGLCTFCEKNGKMTPQEAADFISAISGYITDILAGRKSRMGLDAVQLCETEKLMEKCAGYIKANVGVKQVLGLLEIDSIPEK